MIVGLLVKFGVVDDSCLMNFSDRGTISSSKNAFEKLLPPLSRSQKFEADGLAVSTAKNVL